MASPTRRAFTLLEMLLALAVLAMVGVLVATMLAQASDLERDNDRRDATLDITRVVRLMTEQWDDRRSAAPLGRNGETYGTGPGEIAFVTARPILNPGWPLAIVRYRVSLIGASVVEAERRYNLVYEERPLAALGDSADIPESDREKREQWESAQKLVLLKDCTDLRMERFRGAQEAVLEELGPEARGSLMNSDSEPTGGSISAESLQARQEELLRTARSSWVGFDDEVTRLPPAVRVLGKYQGEEFACVFVGAVSR